MELAALPSFPTLSSQTLEPIFIVLSQNFQYNVLACTSKPNFEIIRPDELMANTGVDFYDTSKQKHFLHLFPPKNYVSENVYNTGLVSFSPSSLTQRQKRQWRHHIILYWRKFIEQHFWNVETDIFIERKKTNCLLLHLYTKLNYLQII